MTFIDIAFAIVRPEPFTVFRKERLLAHFLFFIRQVAVFRETPGNTQYGNTEIYKPSLPC